MKAGDLQGAVLAGGESRRMGRDKALLTVAGEPLWRRQYRVLEQAGATNLAVVRRSDQAAVDPAVRHLRDAVAGVGPIAGLHAALLASVSPWIAVLAVDMPRIDAEWFARLQAVCRRGGGAVARHADGFEPLAAIYPREALASVVTRIDTHDYSLQSLLAWLVRADLMAVVELDEHERAAAENWNTPESMDAGGSGNGPVAPGRS